MKVPCKTCEQSGCGSFHDKCERYRAYIAEQDKLKAEKAKDKRPYAAYADKVFRTPKSLRRTSKKEE